MRRINIWIEPSEWRGWPYIFGENFTDNLEAARYFGRLKAWALNLPFIAIWLEIEPKYEKN